MTLQDQLDSAKARLQQLVEEHARIVQLGQNNERAQFGVEGEIRALTEALTSANGSKKSDKKKAAKA